MEEYNALYSIYNTTNGQYWKWSTKANDGIPWNFTDYRTNHPCKQHWQGTLCYISDCTEDATCHLMVLDLTAFNLSGTIASLDGTFKKMLFLSLPENDIHGHMPSIRGLTSLQTFNISYNAFSGQIPDCFYGMEDMWLLYLSNNRFTGTIPESIYQLPDMEYLSLLNNTIGGTISHTIFNQSKLQFLSLAHNQFHGSIPQDLFTMPNISQVYIGDNHFTGRLPQDMGEHLMVLRASGNRLTGTLPASICNNQHLRFLSIYDNSFGGTLPACLSQLSSLIVLQINLNNFQGQIDEVFNSTMQQGLELVDISDNAFEGHIPSELLKLPNLRNIAAAKNCFFGDLPSAICEASPYLRIIALDGLGASDHCIYQLWDPFDVSNAYFGGLLKGTIPSCIWTLPNITTVHLAGNGLTGSLPAFEECNEESDSPCGISRTLSDVVLTHNLLTGTIPNSFQSYPFSALDLSYNKLKGNIENMNNLSLAYSSDADGASLSLKVNRLTGHVPPSFTTAYNIDILTGNLFVCASDGTPLVEHDPGSNTAVCGSQQLIGSITTFCVYGFLVLLLVGLAFLVGAIVRRSYRRIQKAIQSITYTLRYVQEVSRFAVPSEEEMEAIRDNGWTLGGDADLRNRQYYNVHQLLSTLTLIRRLSWLVAAYSLLVCVPTYVTFYHSEDDQYSTQTDTYSWISSAVFLTGKLPAAVLFLVWSFLLVIVLCVIVRHYNLHPLDDEGLLAHIMKLVSAASCKVREVRESFRGSFITAPMMEYNPIKTSEEAVRWRESASFSTFPPKPAEEVKAGDEEKACDSGKISLLDDERGSVDIVVRESLLSKWTNRLSLFTKSAKETFSEKVPMLSIDDMSVLLASRQRKEYWMNFLRYMGVLLINTTVVIGINAAFLLVENDDDIGTSTKIGVQVLMAAFKIVWNIFALRVLITQLPYKKSSVKLHVSMLVFNSILAPCLATAFTDSSCFRDCFVAAPGITISYVLRTCVESYQTYDMKTNTVTTVCTHYTDTVNSNMFTPSFIYYYTCGSKLLTIYIPVFIYIYTILITFLPILYVTFAAVKTERWPAPLLRQLDGALRPHDRGKVVFDKLVRPRSMQAFMIHHVIILLTFGVSCPVLAVVMAATLSVDTLMWQIILTRYIKYDSRNTPFSPQYEAGATRHSADDGLLLPPRKGWVGAPLPIQSTEMASPVGSGRHEALASLPTSEGNSFGNRQRCETEDQLFRLLYNAPHSPAVDDEQYGEQVKEEARLYELHTVCGEAWKSLRAAMWQIMYISMLFYCIILYDLAGDTGGAFYALWVLIAGLLFAALLRIALIDGLKWIYKHWVGGFTYTEVTVEEGIVW